MVLSLGIGSAQRPAGMATGGSEWKSGDRDPRRHVDREAVRRGRDTGHHSDESVEERAPSIQMRPVWNSPRHAGATSFVRANPVRRRLSRSEYAPSLPLHRRGLNSILLSRAGVAGPGKHHSTCSATITILARVLPSPSSQRSCPERPTTRTPRPLARCSAHTPRQLAPGGGLHERHLLMAFSFPPCRSGWTPPPACTPAVPGGVTARRVAELGIAHQCAHTGTGSLPTVRSLEIVHSSAPVVTRRVRRRRRRTRPSQIHNGPSSLALQWDGEKEGVATMRNGASPEGDAPSWLARAFSKT